MRIAFFTVLFFFTSCAWSNSAIEWDKDASEAQRLLRSAVKVEVEYKAKQSLTIGAMSAEVTSEHESSGSGSVVALEPGKTLVLTADHVCNPKDDGVVKGSVVISVLSSWGERFKAKAIYGSDWDDTCVLAVDGESGIPVVIADSMPSIGARVMSAGAPMGLFDRGVGVVEDSRYSGMRKFGEKELERFILSSGTSPGASGSGVFYRGELFGVVSATATRSGFLVIGAPLPAVRRAMSAALKQWPEKQ